MGDPWGQRAWLYSHFTQSMIVLMLTNGARVRGIVFKQEKYFAQIFPFFMKVRIIRFGTKFKTAIKKLERKLSKYVIQLKS